MEMKPIKFDILIYADIISMAKNGIDLKEQVIGQINQGDPVWDETICEGICELFGDEATDKACQCDLNNYVNVKEDTLHVVEANETYEAGDAFICMGISCEFDLDRFAKDYCLEQQEEKGI